MTDLKRRTFLKGTLAGSIVTIAAGSGLLRPARVLAAQWSTGAFSTKNIADALKELYGTSTTTESKQIKIKAPLQAENGGKVPISVSSTLPGVESIDILVQENAVPLAGRAHVANARGFFSTRIKMAKSSNVHAVIKAGGKLHTAKMKIKVTVGGCGG